MIERIPDPASLSGETIWDDEWKECVVSAALEKLRASVRPLHFQMFYLYALKGQSVRQVADSLGVSAGKVYVAKYRVGLTFKRLVELARKEIERTEDRPPGAKER